MHSIDLETAPSPAEHFVEYFLNKNYFFKSVQQSIFNKKDSTSEDRFENLIVIDK